RRSGRTCLDGAGGGEAVDLLDLARSRDRRRARSAGDLARLHREGRLRQVPPPVSESNGEGPPLEAGREQSQAPVPDPVAWDLAQRVAVRVAGREPFAESYHYASLEP